MAGIKNVLNTLKRNLGEYDAVNEYTKLILREFISEISINKDVNQKLQQLSQKHGIRVNEYKTDILRIRNTKNYITTFQLCLETFLKEINELGKKFSNKWKNKTDEESWLKHIVDNIFEDQLKKEYKSSILLCEYYRGIRNLSVHDLNCQKKDCI